MPKTSFYYTLLVRDSKSEPWEIHFGDYDRNVVSDERDDWCDHYDENNKRRQKNNTLIVTTSDESMAAINAKVTELNANLK